MRGTSLAVWWTVFLVFHEDSSLAIHLSCPRCHPVGHWVDRYPVDYQTIGAVTWLHFRRTEPHSGCQERRYFPRLSSDPVLSLLYLSSDHANIEFSSDYPPFLHHLPFPAPRSPLPQLPHRYICPTASPAAPYLKGLLLRRYAAHSQVCSTNIWES